MLLSSHFNRLLSQILLLCAGSVLAQTPYPTAGGAGGQIITVTSLEDDGPGSLRQALETDGPRIIRFDVGGEIWLKDKLSVSKPFVTVDGESAPSPGITLMGNPLRIRSHDVILRHLRVRVGALLSGFDPQNRDGIQIDGAEDGSDPGYNVLVENCSVSWAVDENIQIWGLNNHDIVVRNCIIAEGLRKSIHPKGGSHSTGLVAGPGISKLIIQGNLFAHNDFRNPVISGGSSALVLNNLIYNPGFNAFHVYGRVMKDGRPASPKELIIFDKDADPAAGVQVSVIGNVVVGGPSTSKKGLGLFHERGLGGGSKIYLKDNIAVEVATFDESSRPPGWEGTDESPFVQTPPVAVPNDIQVLTASAVEASVLANAGARPSDRDAVDKRIVEEVTSRTGSIRNFPSDVRLGSAETSKKAVTVINPAFTKHTPGKNADAAWLLVKAMGEAQLEIIGISEGSAVVKQDPKTFTFAQATDPDRWRTAEIKFKSNADTDVTLRLSARYSKLDDEWVYLDNIKTTACKIANPDFETGDGTKAEGWEFRRGRGNKKSELLQDPDMAASGTSFVKISHGCPVVQIAHIQKDTEITLSFVCRSVPK